MDDIVLPTKEPENQDHLWCKCEWQEGSYYLPKGEDKKNPYRACWRCNSCSLLVKTS